MAHPRASAADESTAVVALDLGGTKLAGALFTPAAAPHERAVTPLSGRQGRAVAALVTDELRRLLAAAAGRGQRVVAVGVSVPGIVQPTTGRVWAPNIPGWDDYPLRDEVAAEYRRLAATADAGQATADAPAVVVDSDRAAYILGEAWQGAARGCRNAAFLAVGTGIGAGILADGRVLRGAGGVAGAIGWWALDRPYEADYRTRGCFESRASGHGLAEVARRLLGERAEGGGRLSAAACITARDILEAYDDGDQTAVAAVRQAVELWGMAAANLVSLLNPERIVFGGGVFGPAARLLADIRAEAQQWAQPVSIGQVEFVASMLGGDAGLYGAARLAIEAAEGGESPPEASPAAR